MGGFILFAGLVLLWLVFAQAQLSSLIIGLPVVLAAVFTRGWIRGSLSGFSFNWVACLRLILLFISGSVRGALDVGLRTLKPDMPIQPVLFSYPLNNISVTGRTILAAVVTLMPGTLAARLADNVLTVHSLSPQPEVIDDIQACAHLVTQLWPEHGAAHV